MLRSATDDHVATVATVATVGTALGHVGLATERDRARAAVTTTQVALDLVDERGLRHDTSLRTRADGPVNVLCRSKRKVRQMRSERPEGRRRVSRRRGNDAIKASRRRACGRGAVRTAPRRRRWRTGCRRRRGARSHPGGTSAPLTHDDRAGADVRARVHLHAEPLRGRVATVAGGGGALLLRHLLLPFGA